MDDFTDIFVPNIQSANKTNYAQWKQSNPAEAAKWEAFRDAAIAHKKGDPSIPVPTMATKYGKALVAAGKLHVSVTDIGAVWNPPPPPPPPGNINPYWQWNGTTGFYSPFSTTFQAYNTALDSHIENWGGNSVAAGSGAYPYDTTISDRGIVMCRDTALRVSLRTTPAPPHPGGVYVSRQEIRTTDPPWNTAAGGSAYDKATIRNLTSDTMNGAFQQGVVRWFAHDYYLPLNGPGGDTFNWSVGGTNPFHTLMDIHGNGNNYEQNWNVLQSEIGPLGNNNCYHRFRMAAHEGQSDPAPFDTEFVNLDQLTDGSGNRVSASYNTWHELVVGVKFASDGIIGASTGWVEIWRDGVQLLPQHSRPTCFPNETGTWLQQQNYKNHSGPLFGSATSSVVYYGGMRIGLSKSDVSYH